MPTPPRADRDGRHLSLENAALGCRTHHRTYDRDPARFDLDWQDDRPILRPRPGSSQPRAGPAP